MSYIVPREKPKACRNCGFLYKTVYDCKLMPNKDYEDFDTQYANCPLVEVQSPHGDLIDRDKLIEVIGERPYVGVGINDDDDEFDSGMSCQWGRDTGAVKDMPAIIKAEGSDT